MKHLSYFVKYLKFPSKRKKLYRFFATEKSKIEKLPVIEAFNNTLLLLKTDDIGDYLLWRQTLPLIRKNFKHKIVLIANVVWKDLFEFLDAPFVDECYWLNKKQWNDEKYRNEWYEKVRAIAPEIAVNPLFTRNYRIDDLLLFASGAKERICWDYSLQKGFENQQLFKNISTKNIFTNKSLIHEFYRNNEFIEKWIGQTTVPNKPCIELNDVKRDDNRIILFPGANANSRKWKSNNVIAVGKFLLNKGYNIILAGGPADTELCKQIETGLNNDRVQNKCGVTTLPQLVETIASGALCITNDTGALHIAVSVGTPAVCISNGFHYTRFTDYRKFPDTKVQTFVPPKFEKKYVSKGILAEKEYYTSQEINEVLPEVVMSSLATEWWKTNS